MSQEALLYEVIKRPLITEKSTAINVYNKYVFEVKNDANKIEIKKAVELAFPGRKVTDVATIPVKGKKKRVGKKVGRTKDTRKAVVTIVGEPIELFGGS